MYVSGSEHPYKNPCIAVLDSAAIHTDTFFTDAEVFQEILHRFKALRRWPESARAFGEYFALMADRIEPMLADDVERAATMADWYPRLSARDLVHVAVMQRVGAAHIVTADTAFDGIDGVERLDPALVEEWRGLVVTARG